MEIALICVGGLIALTFVAAFFDYLGKKQAGLGGASLKRVETLEREVAALRKTVEAREERVERLETELTFVNKLIGDGRGESPPKS